MADRGTHACVAARTHGRDRVPDRQPQPVSELLGHVELDVLAALARERVNAVLVAQRLERLHHQRQRLLLDIEDGAPLRAALGRRRVNAPEVGIVVVRDSRPLRLAEGIGHGLAHRCREVDEKGRRDLAPRAVAPHVHAFARRHTGADVAAGLDGAVQVDLVAVRDLAHPLGGLGPDVLELPAHAPEQGAVTVVHGLQERGTRLAPQALLVEPAPAAQVAALVVVPLVVEEAPLRATHVPERAPQQPAVRLGAPRERVHQLVRGDAVGHVLGDAGQRLGRDGDAGLAQRVEHALRGVDAQAQLCEVERRVAAEVDRLGLELFQLRPLERHLDPGRAQQLEAAEGLLRARVDVGRGRRHTSGCVDHGVHQPGRVRVAKRVDPGAERAAHQGLEQPARSLYEGERPAALQRERHRPVQVAAQPGVPAAQAAVDAVVLEHSEETAHEARLVEAGEEQLELPGLRPPPLGLARRQRRHAAPRLSELEGPGPQLEEAELVHQCDLVEAQVLARVRKLLDGVGEEEGDPVAERGLGPELALERLERLQVEVATRDALREEREQSLGLDELDAGGLCFHADLQGSSTSTISLIACTTSWSSVTARAMATSQARRGSMPRAISLPA